jgi:hypothetical protein
MVIMVLSALQNALSTNPAGTRLDWRSACCMALILPNKRTTRIPDCIKSESDPKLHAETQHGSYI